MTEPIQKTGQRDCNWLRPEIRALVLGFTAMLVGFPLIGWGYFLTHMVPNGHTDFRATYTAGYMLRTGIPLYDPIAQLDAQNRLVSREEIALPFNHPAYEALIYAPLSFFHYKPAYWIWFAANLLFLGLIYRNLRPDLAPLSLVAPWLPVVSLAAYLPFGAALVQGQDSILAVWLFSLAFSLLQGDENRTLSAGMCLGLTAFRFQILIPIIVCFALWRRWAVLIGILTTALPAAVVSVLLAGFRPYLRMLIEFSGRGTPGLQRLVTCMPTLRGLIQSSGGGTGLLVGASLLVLCIGFLAGRVGDVRHQLALAITVAILISYHSLVHDLSVLFIPLAMLLSCEPKIRSFWVVGIGFLSPVVLIFAPNHFYYAVFGILVLFSFQVSLAVSAPAALALEV